MGLGGGGRGGLGGGVRGGLGGGVRGGYEEGGVHAADVLVVDGVPVVVEGGG